MCLDWFFLDNSILLRNSSLNLIIPNTTDNCNHHSHNCDYDNRNTGISLYGHKELIRGYVGDWHPQARAFTINHVATLTNRKGTRPPVIDIIQFMKKSTYIVPTEVKDL